MKKFPDKHDRNHVHTMIIITDRKMLKNRLQSMPFASSNLISRSINIYASTYIRGRYY